jgi:phosphoglycerate dehydrogenase-like enzyme
VTPLRIAVLDDYQRASERLADWSRVDPPPEVTVLTSPLPDVDALVRTLRDVDVVVAMRERTAFPRSVLEQLTNLRLLVTTGMVNAAVDLAAAADLGIVVAGTGGLVAPTTELTWGLILAVLRNIPAEDAAVRGGRWQHTVGGDLAGRTLGLLGLGRQGAGVAKVALAFDMEVVAWSRNLTAERARAHGVERVELADLLGRADVVSVHLVLSDRTRHLLGRDQLQQMKPGAVLVNTSRGPIVDEAALVEALERGWIAGAGLDVYDLEPLPADHPLTTVPNTVLTPHLGYVTEAMYEVFYREAVEDVAAWSSGRPVRVLTEPNPTPVAG